MLAKSKEIASENTTWASNAKYQIIDIRNTKLEGFDMWFGQIMQLYPETLARKAFEKYLKHVKIQHKRP